jgi:hypothetical protein
VKEKHGSCIDLILSNNPKHTLEYDHTTLAGLSDHALVITHLRTAIPPNHATAPHDGKPTVLYRWVEGTRINNYATSANSWLEFTQRPDFVEGL